MIIGLEVHDGDAWRIKPLFKNFIFWFIGFIGFSRRWIQWIQHWHYIHELSIQVFPVDNLQCPIRCDYNWGHEACLACPIPREDSQSSDYIYIVVLSDFWDCQIPLEMLSSVSQNNTIFPSWSCYPFPMEVLSVYCWCNEIFWGWSSCPIPTGVPSTHYSHNSIREDWLGCLFPVGVDIVHIV